MIPHNSLTIEKDEKKAALRVLDSGWLKSGKQVKKLEDEICKFFSLPKGHAIMVSSGSSALYLALWSLKAKNKKVGLPVYSCSSLRHATHLIGAKPIYLDCAFDNPNIDIDIVKKKNLDILIAPSIYGIPVKLKKNLPFKIIEDISHAFGSKINGEKIGLRGEIAICSFAATKLITTGGQGGVIISKKKTIIDKLKDYRDFDNRDDDKIRFNFLLTDMQAAIGRIQLQKIEQFKRKREQIFQIYKRSGLNLLDQNDKNFESIRYRAILINPEPLKFISKLKKFGVSSIIPLRIGELLNNSKKFVNAKKFTSTLLALPMYPLLSKQNVLKISKITLKITHDLS